MAQDKIVVLYCGSYFTKALYEKILYLEQIPILLPSNTSAMDIAAIDPAGIIITGSPNYVNDPHAYKVDVDIYDMGIPIFGICYGMQRMAVDLGGTVMRMPKTERELCHLNFIDDSPSILFQDFTEEGAPVWMVHICKVTEMPHGFVNTAYTDMTECAAMENPDKGLYAVQFHPEHRGTGPANQAGTAMIWKFLRDVCGCSVE